MEKLGPNIVIMNIRLAIFRTDFSLWEVTSFEAKILVTLKHGSIGSDIVYIIYRYHIWMANEMMNNYSNINNTTRCNELPAHFPGHIFLLFFTLL